MIPRFEIDLDNPGERLIGVTLTLPPSSSPRRLSLPAWIPGSYMIRDFARHVVDIVVEDEGGHATALEWLDKQSWALPASATPRTIRYRVHANDLSVRGAHFDGRHAFFNGTSLFLCPAGMEQAEFEVRLRPPADPARAAWAVATGLEPLEVDARGFGLYRAEDYEALIDHPFEVGDFCSLEFEVAGVPHRMVFSGAHPDTDLARIARDVARVCEAQIDFFGRPAPFERYLFMVAVEAEGYGGLEHRNSTALVCDRESLPRRGELALSDDYLRFLGLCSHEYFHSWNVKRIRPAAFESLPLAEEAYTRLLWVFEGFTSYYDDLFLLRAGLIDAERYLGLLAGNLNRVYRGEGRHRQTLEESSLLAWTKFYKQDENAPNAIVSYYTKGAMVALLLDLTLRRDGAASLDALVRRLWRDHGQTGIGLPEGEAIEALASELAGKPLTRFFDRALRSTEPLPVTEMLVEFGVKSLWLPEVDGPDIGALFQADARGEARVSLVYAGRPAARAGLCADDIVIAVDGQRVDGANIQARLRRTPAGRAVRLAVFRRKQLMTVTLLPDPPLANQLRLCPDEQAGPAERQRRAHWLGGNGGDSQLV